MSTDFFHQSIYNYRGLCTWLNWPAFLSNTLFRPAFLVVTFALVARFARGGEAEYAYVIGMIAYGATTILSGGIMQCFANERTYGTLAFLFVSPAGRLRTFLSRAVPHYPNALLCYGSGLAAAALILGTDFSQANWPAVVTGFLTIALSISLFCLFLGSLCIIFRDWLVAAAFSEAALLIFTGVIIPVEKLPGVLGRISAVLPITHGLQALRQAFSGAAISGIAPALFQEAAVGVGYLLGGYLLFRLFELHVRRTGAYENA